MTCWNVRINTDQADYALSFCGLILTPFDTSKLESVQFDLGRRGSGVYGRCWYPKRGRMTYRISCQVPGP